MRHIVVVLLTLTLLIAGCTTASYALDGSSGAKPRKDLVMERREEQKEKIASRVAEHKEKIASHAADIKERLAEHREKMASRAAELKERLAAFKDKQKAKIVERVNTTLNKINDVRTNAMTKHLEKMGEILTKLQDRVDTKKGEGKDTAAADAAIASASAAIKTAQDAVDAQALKDYTIKVSSESGVKDDAKAARDKLHTDLEVVRKLVIAAKQSVANAIRVAATTLGGIGEGSDKEASEGGESN